ncbi:MAG: hypothetical protein Q8922_00840 [Bacteroidota bacterium]|nr:hypothetical protein [Bacteroidota bacterium]MDP4232579.1 hypothetical protein [Bacteroidota bacterium]MDP4242967.1 hypothetical protein [Bacteroidota bacterium]MDP4286458.1 hypothetical protein [Bacteroidota bacterium]
MTLEENVLAYLDGSLDESSSAELLHTLSTSPEKRAVLDEHLRMNDLLAAGRRPFAVPASAERQLATRLPALGSAIERTILRPTGFIGSGFRAVQSFFSDHAIIAASAAGILATAGGLWWNASRIDPPISLPASSNSPVVSLPNQMATKSEVGSTVRGQHPTSAINQPSSMAPHSSPAIARSSSRFGQPSSAIAHSASMTARPASVIAHAPSITHRRAEMVARSSSEASAQPALGPQDASIFIVGQPTMYADAAIPFPTVRMPRTLHEITFGLSRDRVHPFSVGLNMAASGYYLPTFGPSSTTSPIRNYAPEITVDYDLTESFAFGMEAGIGWYGKLGTHFVLDPSLNNSNYARGTYLSDIQGTQAYYVRASTHVTLAPTSDYPVRLGLSGGFAFEGSAEPCATLSAGVSRVLSDDLTLDFGLVASGIWGVAAVDAASQIPAGVTGIVHAETSAQRTFTSAVGLRAGFRYRP